MFDVSTNSGVASIIVPNTAWFDAAVTSSRELGGIEFPAEKVTAKDGVTPMSARRGTALVTTLTMHPESMSHMALALLSALGTPAYNSRQWGLIRSALYLASSSSLDNPHQADELRQMADDIGKAYR